MEPSTLEKLIRGIWEQIHGSLSFDLRHVVSIPKNLGCPVVADYEQIEQWHEAQHATTMRLIRDNSGGIEPWQADNPMSNQSFRRMNQFCHRMTQASRSCRALEVIVQARWVQSFDQRVDELTIENTSLSPTECRMRALAEACEDFGWSEKELRNKM
jgi:ATP-dependent RNA helicase DDX49/DBP8